MDNEYYLKYTFIFLSAIMASLAFVFPYYCAEFIFIFLIPLFYSLMRYSLTYKEGFLWGLLFYSLFFFDLFRLLIQKGCGSLKFFACVFLLIYASLYSALWIAITTTLITFFGFKKRRLFFLIPFIGFGWLYFWWIESSFFWIFGVREGNCLQHLIVPLAVRIQWLYFLPLLGKELYTVIIIGMQASVSIYGYKKGSIIWALCLMLLGTGWVIENKNYMIPAPINSLGCIIPWTSDYYNEKDAAEHIMMLLEEFSMKYPDIPIIIMPESSFKFPLNTLQSTLRLWKSDFIKTIIIGSHRKENNQLFNTLFLISEGKINDYYDKNHLFFFTERIPSFLTCFSCVKQLFLHNKCTFNPSRNKNNKDFFVQQLGYIKPLICSDLFFNAASLPSHSTFICCVNDSWFASSYIPRLMMYYARVTALLKQSSFIYVGYRYALFISKGGRIFPLPILKDK